MFDAVTVFAHGLSALDRGHKLKLANLSCDLEQPWNDGLSLYNYLDSASVDGLTGKIEFNEGKRVNFKLDLLKLKREDLAKVGEWTPERGLTVQDPNAFYETNITKITVSSRTLISFISRYFFSLSTCLPCTHIFSAFILFEAKKKFEKGKNNNVIHIIAISIQVKCYRKIVFSLLHFM
jgi:Receptor family ligand binding region